MAEFEEVVAEARSLVVWSREADDWLPSAGSGGSVPWSWALVEVCRLLRDYQGGGVTRAVLAGELQRRWGECAHRFGRTMSGEGTALERLRAEGSVAFEAVLEARLGRVSAGSSAGVRVHEVEDRRGERAEWYVHDKLSGPLERGEVHAETLLRMTGLRCAGRPRTGTGRRTAAGRLLPTELFTVLVGTLGELERVRDTSEGCMWARVAEAEPEEGRVTLEVAGARRRLALDEEQGAFARLVKAGDTLVLTEPVVGRLDETGVPLVELGSRTVVWQHACDPLAEDEGYHEAKRDRLERVSLRQLREGRTSCATTVLVRVAEMVAVTGEVVTLRVEDEEGTEEEEGEGGCMHVHWWGERGVREAGSLEVGCWVVMEGMLAKRGKDDKVALHGHSEAAWGSRLTVLPLAGLLSSLGLWRPVLSLALALQRPGGGPVAGVAVAAMRLPTPGQRVCVRLDDGQTVAWAEAGKLAQKQFECAAATKLSDVVGTKWHMWVLRESASAVRIECCVPLHVAQSLHIMLE